MHYFNPFHCHSLLYYSSPKIYLCFYLNYTEMLMNYSLRCHTIFQRTHFKLGCNILSTPIWLPWPLWYVTLQFWLCERETLRKSLFACWFNFVILTVLIKFNDVETRKDEDNEEPNNVEDDEEDEVDNAEEELDAYEALDLVLTSLCSDFTFCWMFLCYIRHINFILCLLFFFSPL